MVLDYFIFGLLDVRIRGQCQIWIHSYKSGSNDPQHMNKMYQDTSETVQINQLWGIRTHIS
jgi:hypothetical protein